MIDYLHLSGIGVIDDAELDLAGGLTVLTGETGVGKTLILSGLGLLLGGKPRPDLISRKEARVEGSWGLREGHPAIRRVLEAGASLCDGQLVISRSMSATGRGRCVAGGTTVPVTVLAEVADELVAVHGQSNQILLRKPSAQRVLLDRYAGEALDELLDGYREAYQQVIRWDGLLADAVNRGDEVRREAESLRVGLEAIAQVDPVPGEVAQLQAQSERLARVDELQSAIRSAASVFSVSDDDAADVQSLVSGARRVVDAVVGADAELASVRDRIIEMQTLSHDLAGDLWRYLDGLESDPDRLEQVQRRLADIADLTRRFGPGIEDVLMWAKAGAARLLELESAVDVPTIGSRRDEARQRLTAAALALRAARLDASARLADAATGELRELGMPKATLCIDMSLRDASADQDPIEIDDSRIVGFGPDGIDVVQILLAPHPGARPAPVAKAASGGELSRVMLALEVVMAANSHVTTFVFDEVDAGVGGKAAIEVGRRLAQLADRAQVIVVTHLAQVAAFADDHLVVEKSSAGEVTRASVRHVRGEDRVKEVARMLSGQDESSNALAHAMELLELASQGETGR